MEKAALTAIGIVMEEEERQVLFIMLGRDGAVTRMGDGSTEPNDMTLYVGRTEAPLFGRFVDYVPQLFLDQPGSFTAPDPGGTPYNLVFLFQSEGESRKLEVAFGAENGPPDEMYALAALAVELTEEWYEAQQRKS